MSLHTLPKVELHLHLEGAIPLPALWRLVEKYGARGEVPSLAALEERFRYTSFEHFIETWVWKNRFLREYEDFTTIAEAVADDLAAQNVRYVEAFISPGDFASAGLEPQALVEAVRRGLDRHGSRIRVQLVVDLIRDFGPERGARWLDQVAEVRHLGIVGIGLGGSEPSFPPEPYAAVFEKARRLGFRTTAHAGEAAGPESVRGAIETLRVDRIGHGVRAIEDPAVVDLLRRRRIPLEVCPLSNVRTRVVPDLASHPLARLRDQGVLVTVNTDDPRMFDTSLAAEYEALMDVFGFTLEDVVGLIENAVDAAWCDESTRQALLSEVRAHLPQREAVPGGWDGRGG